MQGSIFSSQRLGAQVPELALTGGDLSASCRLFDDEEYVLPATPFITTAASRAQRQHHNNSNTMEDATASTCSNSVGHHSTSEGSRQCLSSWSQQNSSGSTLEYLEPADDVMRLVIAPKPAASAQMRVVRHHDKFPSTSNFEWSGAVPGLYAGPATCAEDGFATEFGPRKQQEDNYVAFTERKLWGVFDGHRGHASSSFASSFLIDHMDVVTPAGDGRASRTGAQMLADSVAHLEASMKASAIGEADGTTACIAHVGLDGVLRIANVGDSRAVLCSQRGVIQFATVDHKNTCSFEAIRISQELSAHHAIMDEAASQRQEASDLSVTRALGNFDIKQRHIGLSSMVDVYEVFAAPGDVLVIASDGVWDVISPQDAVNLVLSELGVVSDGDAESQVTNATTPRNGPRCAAQALVRCALDRRTGDNCTAVVVRFKW